MIRNYWRIAWRNIARNKVYTFINILGLALGICGCLVLFLPKKPGNGLGEKSRPERLVGKLSFPPLLKRSDNRLYRLRILLGGHKANRNILLSFHDILDHYGRDRLVKARNMKVGHNPHYRVTLSDAPSAACE